MIPKQYVRAWSVSAPWLSDSQIEQDLILSRALVELYQVPLIQDELVFRGGTALHKLFIQPPARYSEDLDFVQIKPGPIGKTVTAIRKVLDPWLGKPQYDRNHGRVTIIYRFLTTEANIKMRLKIEINTREHFTVFGFENKKLSIENPWFQGESNIRTYAFEELLGSKLRALYQRKKGRDLFDLYIAKTKVGFKEENVIKAFHQYMKAVDAKVSRAEFEANLFAKKREPAFAGDMQVLLAPDIHWEVSDAFSYVLDQLVPLLPGEPWKGDSKK